MISRRRFLAASAGLAACASARNFVAGAAEGAGRKRVLVASQWHNVNIGDIAHGPGLVRLIRRYLPDVDVSLWPAVQPTDEIRAMMLRAYPELTIVDGVSSTAGRLQSPESAAEIARCDLMILASGGYHPFPVAGWRELTRLFGNGFEHMASLTPEVAEQLNTAKFVYGRESLSAAALKRLGVTAYGLTFCPDSTFGFDLRDEQRADETLAHGGLEPGKFICVVPMLRYAPHWKIYGKPPKPADLAGEKTSEQFKEQDHAPLRELIVEWVRQTGLKVYACPEMTYETELAREQLIVPLPPDVKRNVVWRETFWMPDEAAAVYARASAVVSLECHSPILALANGTPAIHLRLPSETGKGRMFADIGLGEWLHEIADVSGAKLAAQVLQIQAEQKTAREKVQTAMDGVHAIYRRVFEHIEEVLRG